MSGYIGLINIDAAAGTSGTSDSTKALQSATTTVNVSAATAPTSGQVLTATSGTAATWQTPAAGSSTQGTLLNLSDTTQSTSKDTGALVVEGGVGVEKNLYVGGNLVVTGTGSGVAEFTATDQTGNYTASSGDWVIYALATAGATLTLPATPTQGDAVRVSLKTEATDEVTNYVAIARNGSTIDGQTTDGEVLNRLWKTGDTVTFRCVASNAWVASERSIQNRFQANVVLSAAQLNLTGGAWNVVDFDTELYDYNGNYDATTNYRYTAPVSGIYTCTGWVRLTTTGSAGDRMLAGFFVGGAETKVTETISDGVDPCNVGLTVDIELSAGDTIDFRALPNTGLNTTDVNDLVSQTFVQYKLVGGKGSSGGGGGLSETSLTLTDTTQSTSKDTGALIVEGGVGIEKDLYVGGAIGIFKSGAQAYLITTPQTIATATWTKIALNAEQFDGLNEFDSTTNYRFTVTTAGRYLITYSCTTAASLGDGTVFVTAVRKNGSPVIENWNRAPTASTTLSGNAVIVDLAAASDYYELWAYQASGGNVDIQVGSQFTYLCVQRIT